MENTPNQTDRISQLPQDIIERILFFLPAKDAARTSILSKTWLHVWKSLPVFSFRSDAFIEILEGDGCFDDRVDKYMDAIDKSLEKLRNFKVLIKHLKLQMFVQQERQASRIHQFIELATRNYVDELFLCGLYYYPRWMSCQTLPSATFVSNSFSVLHIKACVLTPTLFGENPKFPCLRNLSLRQVRMDDRMVQSLLANCPLLEKFHIEVLDVENVVLPNLPKLEQVTIVGVRRIVIEASNIQILHCEYRDDNLELGLVSCDDLKELSLFAIFTAEYIQDLVANLPSLKTLVLRPYSPLEGLKISNQQLSHLTLHSKGLHPIPKEVAIDCPNLLCYYFYVRNIFSAEAAMVSINTLKPLKAVLHVGPWGNIDHLHTEFFIGLKNYLQSFKFDVLRMNLFFDTNESVLEQVREASSGAPPAYLKRLSLESVESSFDFAAFLDCLFWICRPKMISIRPEKVSSTELIEQLSPDKMISREMNPQCCSNCPRKCWRHYLEDIKIKKIVGMKNENVQHGHDIALNCSSACEKLVLELTWNELGQKRKSEE